jgi:hypothetical protein
MMEAVSTFETSVKLYQITRPYGPEYSHVQLQTTWIKELRTDLAQTFGRLKLYVDSKWSNFLTFDMKLIYKW